MSDAKTNTPARKSRNNSQNTSTPSSVQDNSVDTTPVKQAPKSTEVKSCSLCNKSVKESHKAVKCNKCIGWFHSECSGVTTADYKLIQKSSDSIKWFCKICTQGNEMSGEVEKLAENKGTDEKLDMIIKYMSGMRKEMKDLNVKVDKIGGIEKTVGKHDKQIGELQTEVKQLHNKLDDLLAQQTEPQPALQDDMKKLNVRIEEMEKKGNPTVDGMEPATNLKNVVKTVKDWEDRENNVVVHRLEESKAENIEVRKQDDVTGFLGVTNDICELDVSAEELGKVIRLGKKREDGSFRPLLVQIKSLSRKRQIMRNLVKLREKRSDISVNHDMSKSEREHIRKLVVEADDLSKNEKSGEFVYRVRGPPWDKRIVKMARKSMGQK